jgi:hypothetical protein
MEDERPVQVLFSIGTAEIDKCENLFVDEIGEAGELRLSVKIVEARVQSRPIEVNAHDPLHALMLGARPIEPDDTSMRFELIFDSRHMVSYLVLNELYGTYPAPPEEFTGRLFRTFTKSHLLDFTRRTTNASDAWPGKLLHYQIACLNHVVDVVVTAPPTIYVQLPKNSPPGRC